MWGELATPHVILIICINKGNLVMPYVIMIAAAFFVDSLNLATFTMYHDRLAFFQILDVFVNGLIVF